MSFIGNYNQASDRRVKYISLHSIIVMETILDIEGSSFDLVALGHRVASGDVVVRSLELLNSQDEASFIGVIAATDIPVRFPAHPQKKIDMTEFRRHLGIPFPGTVDGFPTSLLGFKLLCISCRGEKDIYNGDIRVRVVMNHPIKEGDRLGEHHVGYVVRCIESRQC